MRSLDRAVVLTALVLIATQAAFATGWHHSPPPPPPPKLPLEVQVVPTLASVTRSQSGLTTYAQYTVSIRNPNTWGLGLIKGKFTATTAVLPAGTGTAPFFLSDNPACSANPDPTSFVCTLPDLPPGASIAPFTVTLTAPPFTPPANGGQIDLTHKSSAAFNKDASNNDPIVTTPAVTVSTALTDPNPTTVATVLPLATGGTVFTGTEGGAATCDQPWVTITQVPKAATVNLDLTTLTAEKPICASGTCEFFANLRIPGTFGTTTSPPTELLVVTLRRDRCTIEGRGIIGKALDVLQERVFYRGATTTGVEDSQYVKVLPCRITGGPVAATATAPGRPCIASRKFYLPWNLPDVPNKSDYLFDQEWIIWANDNGKYAN
jgi:hypothetical protein